MQFVSTRPTRHRALRHALGQFATGVTVVTLDSGTSGPVGMTMNSFGSVSLDPPLVLFSIDKSAYSFAAFTRARGFAVNVLRHDQQALADRFARSSTDKWAGVAFSRGYEGAPLIDDALAHFECAIWATYDGGDHLIFVCRVIRFTARDDETAPLLFYRGRYTTIPAHTDSTRPAGEPS